jgi:hypothetical protein
LGASRQGERIQWDVSVKRSIAPIGLGLLAREDQAALGIIAGTSERSTLNLSFNVIRADPVIFFRYLVYSGASWEQLSAEWKYNFSPNWSVSAAYLQARARSGNLQEWANGNQARLAILWQSGRL